MALMLRSPLPTMLPRKAVSPQPGTIKGEPSSVAIGGKLLYIVPGLGIQGWLNKQVGLSLHSWLMGSTSSGTALYQANILFKTRLGKINPIFGVGYANSILWSSGNQENGKGMFNASLGLNLGDDNFYFLPALEVLSGNGETIPLFTVGFYWWV